MKQYKAIINANIVTPDGILYDGTVAPELEGIEGFLAYAFADKRC